MLPRPVASNLFLAFWCVGRSSFRVLAPFKIHLRKMSDINLILIVPINQPISQSDEKVSKWVAYTCKEAWILLNLSGTSRIYISNSEGSKRLQFSILTQYSRICKYEFPKRSLYLFWDNFKQSVGLQGFYQFYYTLAKCLAERARQCHINCNSLFQS